MSLSSSVESQTIGVSLQSTGNANVANAESPDVGFDNRVNQSPAASTATTQLPTSTSASTVDKQATYSNPTEEDKSKYGPLFPFGLKDVKISAIDDQATVKGRRNVNTRLIGIGSVATVTMDSKHLRNWGNREKMNLRNSSKKDYAVAIVSFTEQHRRMQQSGRSLAEPETIYARSRINFTRAVNVLSYEPFKAQLVHRGSQITRADLDNGVRADEELWKSFASIYNQKDTAVAVMELDDLKYDGIDWNGNEPDPSQFTPIDWKKAQSSFKEIAKKYDMAHKKWKASGFHDGFESVPFTEFAGQKWLCYMHAFVQANPGILDTITSDLAEGTFFESSTGHSDEHNESGMLSAQSASSKKRKATMVSNAARDHLLKTIADSTVTSAAANQEKSKAIKLAAIAQTRSTTQSMLAAAKVQKKEALQNLKGHALARKENTRVRIIVNHVAKRQYEQEKINAQANGEQLNEEDEPNFPLSQETTTSIRRVDSFDSVYGFAKDYNDANKQISQCEKALRALDKES